MSNRSHLVPTPMVNKNGVQTTVYRKPRAGAKALPSVSLPNKDHTLRKQLEEAADDFIQQNLHPHRYQEGARKKYRKALKAYGDDMVDKIISLRSSPRYREVLEVVAIQAPPKDFMADFLMFHPCLEAHDTFSLEPFVYGLDYYEGLAPHSEPEKRFEQGAAILKVTKFLSYEGRGPGFITTYLTKRYGTHNNVRYIDNYHVRTLLTTHPNPDAVAEVIIKRDLMDSNEITEVLSAMERSATAIADGVL